jgi:hypothetical protein
MSPREYSGRNRCNGNAGRDHGKRGNGRRATGGQYGRDAGHGQPESATLTSSGDPYWKVGSVYYSVATSESGCYSGTSVSGGTCFISTTPISYALSKIDENDGALLPSDGKLYVLTGTYDEDITFSGSTLTKMKGLIGVDGSSNITVNGDVTLNGMAAGFTLSGLTISGSISITNSSGNLTISDVKATSSDGNGLSIGSSSKSHSGNVSISSSSFDSSYNSGAIVSASGAITVSDSTFNNNGNSTSTGYQGGLRVIHSGVITLNNVTAIGNYGVGIEADDFRSLVMKNIIADSNTTNSYSTSDPTCGRGIYADTNAVGKVTLENVDTNKNNGYGIQIKTLGIVSLKNVEGNGSGSSGIEIATPMAVTINIANADSNGLYGIDIKSSGAVTLTTIDASSNSDSGVQVMEYDGTVPASVTLNSKTSGGSVTANYFSYNGSVGLNIHSRGAITLSNFEVDENSSIGLLLDNCLSTSSGVNSCVGNGNITITSTLGNFWLNGVRGNAGTGLWLTVKGISRLARPASRKLQVYTWRHWVQSCSTAFRYPIT